MCYCIKYKVLIMEILKRILNIFTPRKSSTPQFVDLGLPSGLKWAKCNVGSEKETDYGYYFQWGDIVDKSDSKCTWESYKYCNWSYDRLTKYNIFPLYGEKPDNKTNLDLEDDAARAHMGGDWRMPRKAEIQELLDNTDSEWIGDYNGTGVDGMKFISKTDESKCIFIPASGFRSDSSFVSRGSLGIVWSSSLEDGYPFNALDLFFISDYIDADYGNYRCYGFPVRGVMD